MQWEKEKKGTAERYRSDRRRSRGGGFGGFEQFDVPTQWLLSYRSYRRRLQQHRLKGGGYPSTKKSKSLARSSRNSIEEQVVLQTPNLFFVVLVPILSSIIVFLAVGAVIAALFVWTEEWGYFTSIYFTIITMTTVGYGDVSPKTSSGRWVAIFAILVGTLTAAGAISTAVDAVMTARRNRVALLRLQKTALASWELSRHIRPKRCHPSCDNEIDKFEFLALFLLRLGLVSEEQINAIADLFDKLDEDGSGAISVEEFERAQRRGYLQVGQLLALLG
ncbi:MAG: hypothetical protein MHM6MM_002821 [Cercozoa sp. M6MM]